MTKTKQICVMACILLVLLSALLLWKKQIRETSKIQEYTQDIEALKKLFNNNKDNTLGWNLASNPSEWSGVFWDTRNGYKRVIKLDIHYKNLKSGIGIEELSALETLSCYTNELSILDISNMPELKELECSNNNLTTLDISKNINLINLDCSFNNLSELDVRRNTKLIKLNCSSNNLTTLDISKNKALENIICHDNRFTPSTIEKLTKSRSNLFHKNIH